LQDAVEKELVAMGLVSPEARVVSRLRQRVPSGFPATTHAFMKASAAQTALAAESLPNALLIGRAKCPPFFTTEVLADAFAKVGALAQDGCQRV